MPLSLSKVTVTRMYRIEHLTLYHPEHPVNVKLMTYKIVQSGTGDHRLYIVDTVQKIGLSVAVQL